MIFNIQLTADQLGVIGLGLDELQFKIARPVSDVIQAQINAQIAAANATPAAIATERRRTKSDKK